MADVSIKEKILHLLESRSGELVELAEELYHNPEIGLQEFRTSALLCGKLESEGFAVERDLAEMPTAFRAVYGVGKPTIAFLAEMDALPGLGHACGHNLIAAAAVGAAIALKEVIPCDAASLLVIGTPAEELGIGKINLITAGVFSNVDFAMMVHPSSKRQVLKEFLGLAKIRLIFHGKSAHAAAYPEEGINALDGVIQTFVALNSLRQHLSQEVRVHGVITEGGVAPNIIPERAACYFYVRAATLEDVCSVRQRLIACAEGAALATGCKLEIIDDERIIAPFKINNSFSSCYSRQLAFLGLAETMLPADKNRGSSDIGNLSQVVPTIHPHVPIGDGIRIHTEAFAKATVSAKGKDAVIEGAAAMALTAAELVMRPEIRTEIRAEFAGIAQS